MAQLAVQPSGSEVSKVESDITQTLSLADTIVTLIREPVTLLYQNITKSQELKRNLGYWQEQAIDEHKQCRIPVLRLQEFEEYLVKVDGVIPSSKPADDKANTNYNKRGSFGEAWKLSWGMMRNQTGSPQHERTPTGTSCWAHLLFAMGIRPEMDIIGWRPSNDGFISTQNGGIEIEIDGSVLCHIINLYSLTLDPSPWCRDWPEPLPERLSQKVCNFPFGTLAWDTINGQIHAHFEPGLEAELGRRKQSLGNVGSLMEPNTLMASYFTTLIHGVSDRKFRLADVVDASLLERVSRLLECFEMLRSQPKPLLMSYGWFEEAARIKRRLLAQGGEDHSFFEEICGKINDNPLLSERGKIRMKVDVRERFLFDTETFIFTVPGQRRKSRAAPERGITAMSLAWDTLLGYENQPPGTWKHDLYAMREEVRDMLRLAFGKKVQIYKGLFLLEFTSGCTLWNEKVLLGAPTGL